MPANIHKAQTITRNASVLRCSWCCCGSGVFYVAIPQWSGAVHTRKNVTKEGFDFSRHVYYSKLTLWILSSSSVKHSHNIVQFSHISSVALNYPTMEALGLIFPLLRDERQWRGINRIDWRQLVPPKLTPRIPSLSQ